jgi:hypothetical protein
MKFWEKYTERIEISEEDLDDITRLAMTATMKEGELRYREYLIDVLGRMNELLKDSGEKKPQLTIDAFIKFVEQEPVDE